VATLPALWMLAGRKERLRMAAWSFAVFLLVFGAWPIRNLVQFGKPHLADGMVDRRGNDVPHYLGYWRWMQTWAQDWHPAGYPQACFYDAGCAPTPDLFAADGAFLAPATSEARERERVGELLVLRAREGVSRGVSDGFLALARARVRAHPLRALIGLPASRAWSLWTSPQNELLQNPGWYPWPSLTRRLIPHFRFFAGALLLSLVLAIGALLAIRHTRTAAAILALPIALRTLVLAWTAFSLPRYLVGIYPLCFTLIGAAVGVGVQRLLQARRSAAANA
jgi:hypothetical protein